MVSRWTVCWAFAAVLAGTAGRGAAQEASPPRQGLPEAPVPVPLGATPPAAPLPPPAIPPPPPGPEPVVVVLPPYVGPFDRASPWCGWYTGAEVAALLPYADLHYTGKGRLALDATPSPRVWLGYRFEQGGSVRLSYRNLISSNDNTVDLVGLGEQQDIHLAADMHWLDLDYVSPDYTFHGWDRLAFEVGGRFTFRELGARATDPSATLSTDTRYFGGGPHLGLDEALLLGDSGWSLYMRADGAVTFGGETSHVHFAEFGPFADGIFSFPRQHRSPVEGDIAVQVGVKWTHTFANHNWLRLDGGLQAEGWSFGGEKQSHFLSYPFRSLGAFGPYFGAEIGF